MSSSFGQWYADQKAQEPDNNAPSSSTSGNALSNLFRGGEGDTLPLFGGASSNGEGGEGGGGGFSMSGMKASLEAQLPQKIWGMNYQQRFQMFTMTLLLSALFFALGFTVGIPLLTIRPQKFALCFTFGSLTFMFSFAILKGPAAHLASMITAERLPFTTIYTASMMATLYFTFSVGGAEGYVLVMASSGLQILALLWYLITFLPGGAAGMKVLTQAIVKIMTPILFGCTKVWGMIVSRCFGWLTNSSG